MAIVRKLKRITLEHDSRHSEVNCTYSIIQDEGGQVSTDRHLRFEVSKDT